MGTYKNTYIGCYIEIPHYKKETRRDVLRNPQTKKVVEYKFHPETGLPSVPDVIVENIWITPETYLDYDWVTENGFCEDEFFEPAYTGGKNLTTLLVNSNEFTFKEYLEGDDLFNCDLQSIDIPKMISEFKERYKLYLDYYSAEFKDLKVKFGVVNYAY